MAYIPTLDVRGLICQREHHIVTQELSMVVPPGIALGITGPNGCGKTTVLDTICGLAKPWNGKVLARIADNQTDVTEWSFARRRKWGWRRVFQKSPTLPFRCFSELCTATALSTSPFQCASVLLRHRRQTVEELMSLSCAGAVVRELSAVETPANVFSFGQVRAALISLALSSGGTLILLDEPSVGLSDRMKDLILDALRRHMQSGGSVIMADHDVAFMGTVCTEIVQLTGA